MEASQDTIDSDIGERIKALRAARNLTLDELAARSGVSRAMISRIERGESSATAQLLVRLCAGLGVTLSALFARVEANGSPLSRKRDQAVWRDPGTGYVRRRASPASSDGVLELVDVSLPPGASIVFDRQPLMGADQLVYVLEGSLDMLIGEDLYPLEPGDCLHMRFDRPQTFRNSSAAPTRYVVSLAPGRGMASR